MDIFDQEDIGSQFRGILLAWSSFKSAAAKLIDKYNQISPIGKLHPADIQHSSDTSMVIVCDRGQCPSKSYSALVIQIEADMVSTGQFSIDGKIEEWCKSPAGTVSAKKEKSMTFVLEGNHKLLRLGEEKLTPPEAASKLLEVLLIHRNS